MIAREEAQGPELLWIIFNDLRAGLFLPSHLLSKSIFGLVYATVGKLISSYHNFELLNQTDFATSKPHSP